MNQKSKFCLTGFKLCSSTNTNSNYEFVSYNLNFAKDNRLSEQEDQPIIYIKTKQALVDPQFQSTQINESAQIKPCNPISSTMLKKSTLSFASSDFEPDLSEIDDNHQEQQQHYHQNHQQNKPYSKIENRSYSLSVTYTENSQTNFSSDCSSQCSPASSFNSNSSDDYHVKQTLYVCCVSYQARIQGDLTLSFADRVKLIHMNDENCLVEKITNRQCGYVPSYCIATLDQFLSQVKYLNRR